MKNSKVAKFDVTSGKQWYKTNLNAVAAISSEGVKGLMQDIDIELPLSKLSTAAFDKAVLDKNTPLSDVFAAPVLAKFKFGSIAYKIGGAFHNAKPDATHIRFYKNPYSGFLEVAVGLPQPKAQAVATV